MLQLLRPSADELGSGSTCGIRALMHSPGRGGAGPGAPRAGGRGDRARWDATLLPLPLPARSEPLAFRVESMVSLLQRLPPSVAGMPIILSELYGLDSHSVAALLKELAKKGLVGRAFEIFNWLRTQPPHHPLSHLCDVFSYTTAVALCAQCQGLGPALVLVEEMRARGIPVNTHTYTALMNVAVKSSNLQQALEIFHQVEDASVVTYNTLIDVYGKLGRWQDAVAVLDTIAARGLVPETRTYNTAIIACNMCGQPAEALRVHGLLLAAGYSPTATTYTALVTAHSKAGNVEAALDAFHEMRGRGFERNWRTYSSLLGVCERKGCWQLVLELVTHMVDDRIQPNTLIYNTIISACAQGAQAQAAAHFFSAMRRQRIQPDVLTFASLLRTYQRAGEWRAALQAYEEMATAGCRPSAVCFAEVLEALFREEGQPDAAAARRRVFSAAQRAGCCRLIEPQQGPALPEGPHLATIPGTGLAAGLLALHAWLSSMQAYLLQGGRAFPTSILLSFGSDGQVRQDPGAAGALREAVVAYLNSLGSPFQVVQRAAGVQLEAQGWAFTEFLHTAQLMEPSPSLLAPRPAAPGSSLHAVTAAYLEAARARVSPRTYADLPPGGPAVLPLQLGSSGGSSGGAEPGPTRAGNLSASAPALLAAGPHGGLAAPRGSGLPLTSLSPFSRPHSGGLLPGGLSASQGSLSLQLSGASVHTSGAFVPPSLRPSGGSDEALQLVGLGRQYPSQDSLLAGFSHSQHSHSPGRPPLPRSSGPLLPLELDEGCTPPLAPGPLAHNPTWGSPVRAAKPHEAAPWGPPLFDRAHSSAPG